MNDFNLFATRTVGATLIALAVSQWFATPSTGVLAANAFLNGALGIIDVLAIAPDTIDAASWPGVAVHTMFLIAAFTLLARGHRTVRPRN